MIELTSLLELMRSLPQYRELRDSLAGRPSGGRHLPLLASARPPVAAALASELGSPVLLICARADRMLTLAQELPVWAPATEVITFPEPDPLFYEALPWGVRTRQLRIEALSRLTLPGSPQPLIILTTARAIMTRTLSPEKFAAHTHQLVLGTTLKLEPFLDSLIGSGYETESIVTERGQFSRRGGILDLWPASAAAPVRVELLADEIESIRRFDPATQRSSEAVDRVQVSPAREALPADYQQLEEQPLPIHEAQPVLESFLPWLTADPQTVLDFIPAGTLVLAEDLAGIEATIHELEAQALELRTKQIESGKLAPRAPRPYLTVDEIRDCLDRQAVVNLGTVSTGSLEPDPFGEAFVPGPRFGGQLRPLLDYLAERRLAHETCVLVSRQASRLSDLWAAENAQRPLLERLPAQPVPGELYLMQAALSEGWILQLADEGRIHLLTDAEIFGWSRPELRRRPRSRVPAPESAYVDLTAGDPVVHVDYGVGIFEGLVARHLEGTEREYLLVTYEAGDQLYVPISSADRITRYIGADGAPPRLSRLGSAEWERVRTQASRAVEEVARELLDLYARRTTAVGHAFSKDTPWQHELEASFPYVETEDQVAALDAVKADMERGRPMDRLICGDVGYGKTEVALRAAFKAVMDGKQVGLLVPTTVLAQQHFRTFQQRLAAFPIELEMLSRFRSKAEIKQILERASDGQIDIVIGTHRLLQKDVHFKDLGLLIIDEEQRFGVTHKEHLKDLRSEVDVLTLTATPIPRTLYMALTGARDISTIDTAPEDRLPVVTHTGPYDPALVRQAVLRELDRGGQVFFVHNRVQTISSVQLRLARLLPEVRVEMAHGQMPEQQLANVMSAFTAGEVDMLLSTSIVESGLDIPNANTLIIDRSDQFGLAQLYQLRGRVGRGAVRAYAYFFYHPGFKSTPESIKRLEIIGQHTQLGAGYSIALRDLEMRGAGDLLGVRQHGHIAAIGFHFYTQLLAEAVRRLRGRAEGIDIPVAGLPPQVSIELPLASALTVEYVPDRRLRLQLYRRLAGLRSLEAVDQLRAELSDRFGPPPLEAENLLYQLRVKILAAQSRVSAVSSENGRILLQLAPGVESPEPLLLGEDIRASKRGLWLTAVDWQARLLKLLQEIGELAIPA
ncbi:MAG: transcription-repair coupling factor [Anaerolineales bacterium]